MTAPPDAGRRLYEQSVALHINALREALMRHDENLAAYILLEQCIPYFLRDDPNILQARREQLEIVRHVLDPIEYAKAYSHSAGEQPFEKQFSHLTIETADKIPRIEWLVQQLIQLQPTTVIDLGCNDGWMLQHLVGRTDMDVRRVHGVDLNIDCIERARKRFAAVNGKDVEYSFSCRSIEAAADDLDALGQADAVVCFEVLEHVTQPAEVVDAARKLTRPGGMMFFSTPAGAVEQGWNPNWAIPGYFRGHVRAFTQNEFAGLLQYAATGGKSPTSRPDCVAQLVNDIWCQAMLGRVRLDDGG